MRKENRNGGTMLASKALTGATGPVPSIEEYTAVSIGIAKANGFAIPTNPKFYEGQYSEFVKKWKAQNAELRHGENNQQ